MDDTKRHRVISILFFLAIAGLMAGLSSIVIRNLGSDRLRDWRGASADRAPDAPARTPEDVIVIRAEEMITIGNTRVIYHGTEDGRMIMDVFLLELDPQYPYRKKVDIDHARAGFRLAGIPFQVTAISNAKVFLRRMH